MKPYKIIKSKPEKKNVQIVNKLEQPRVPLRFFKAKNPHIEKYTIEVE